MCGIAGFTCRNRSHSKSYLENIARRMGDVMHHRGPDEGDIWIDGNNGIVLTHRRLSVIDLSSAGSQPMVSACSRFVIVYNGEVYNSPELRAELEQRGHIFRGHSDTEVVLAAIAQWGIEAALRRMNGMFAFGLWDVQERALTLARDRVGKKPLYYGWCGDTFLFGSELKALRAHPDFDLDIDRDALGLFIQYSWIPAPYCIFKHVQKLPAGSFLTVTTQSTLESASPKVYWSARTLAERGARAPYSGSFEEATDGLDALLRDAVSGRMVADVSLGALLSGGIDSSTVVALMQAVSSRPVKTFSIGFHEPKFNEAKHALAIARHLGTDHTELYVTANDSLAVIPKLPVIYDEPFADPSQIPTFIVSTLARGDVTVALSGDGGDELFAGYKRYSNCLRRWDYWRRIPLPVRRGAETALGAIARAGWWMYRTGGSGAAPTISERHRLRAGLERIARGLSAATPQELFARMHARCQDAADFVLGAERVSTVLTDPGRWPDVSEPMQALMYMDLADCLTDDILVKVDRASMAVGLEVRCAFLDVRVIEFAWSLPLSMRIDHTGSKRIVRQVLARYVPRELTERSKMGFGVPVADWLRGPLRESTVAGLFRGHEGDVHLVTPEELSARLSQPQPPQVLDVRTRASFNNDGTRIPGSLRLLPDQVRDWATTMAEDGLADEEYVAYCS